MFAVKRSLAPMFSTALHPKTLTLQMDSAYLRWPLACTTKWQKAIGRAFRIRHLLTIAFLYLMFTRMKSEGHAGGVSARLLQIKWVCKESHANPPFGFENEY
jgi:hypothetical protein